MTLCGCAVEPILGLLKSKFMDTLLTLLIDGLETHQVVFIWDGENYPQEPVTY
jgi:hypothetical protein